jgi:hypothetical protein
MNEQPLKRDWFYWFMVIFTAFQLPIGALVLADFVLHPLEPDYMSQSIWFRLVSAAVIVPVVVFIALLVIRRAPRNLTGLFLFQWATAIIATTIRQDVNMRILYSLSFGWAGLWFLPLYFPDGRALPRRFEHPVRWLCIGLVLSVYFWGLSAPSIGQPSNLPNPLFIAALEGLYPLASTVEGVFLLTVFIFILPSLILRYRGSDQQVRQQLKWLSWAFFGILLSSIPIVITGISLRDPHTLNPLESLVLFLWSIFIMLAPFLAVSIAILRHNLYDIDIIIRKTLIYSLLTGILAVIYFGGVVLVQQLFRSATGEIPDLAIVLSTLLIAALFSPLRRRIQDIIDRRFYRHKYDAEQTLAKFNQTLRDEVDIEALKAHLVGVVQETMRPKSVALWINEKEKTI